jgi:methylated-DNA-[protein]-cysteine S-methyltransferase
MKNPMQHSNHFAAIIDSPLGHLGIKMVDDVLVSIHFLSKKTRLKPPTNTLTKQVVKEFSNYFKGVNHRFSIPLYSEGTPFQQRVWQALLKIPYGKTVTYGSLAKTLGTHARAIGGACRTNPIPIIIPCHRVVGSTNLGGYLGDTIGQMFSCKQWLLEHEKG